MAFVRFTSALNRFFPDIKEMEVAGNTVNDVLSEVSKEVPGISGYLLEDDGSLRKHVNIFIKDELIQDRSKLSDPVANEDAILIYQALSGG